MDGDGEESTGVILPRNCLKLATELGGGVDTHGSLNPWMRLGYWQGLGYPRDLSRAKHLDLF